MLYDRQERQILNEYPNTLAHQLLMIDISVKKIIREFSKVLKKVYICIQIRQD